MTSRTPDALVVDMLESAERIGSLLAGVTKDAFLKDESAAVQDAVSYRLVVVGEAAASLLAKFPDFCLAHPEVPWKSARAMRNFIVHDYMSVDLERLWETAESSIPELVSLLAVTPNDSAASGTGTAGAPSAGTPPPESGSAQE